MDLRPAPHGGAASHDQAVCTVVSGRVGAPVVAIVCLHQDLGWADAMSVGMYVQTLLLGLTARGLGSCCEVSLAAYPDIIRKELGIPPELVIICGVAIGYTDFDFPANRLRVERAPVEHNVAILDSD